MAATSDDVARKSFVAVSQQSEDDHSFDDAGLHDGNGM